MIDIKYSFGYEKICLIPRIKSTLNSRDNTNTSVNFANYNISCPLIASPMPDVCESEMAISLFKLGAFGIIHRFMTKEEQVIEYKKVLESYCNAGSSIGINGDWQERYESLLESGCKTFCIDVANGFHSNVENVINHLKKDNVFIIAGNVASKEGYQFLDDLGVNAVRVGIAGGQVCSTKNETGVLSPMASTILEISEFKNNNNHNAMIIADGGIKQPADFCKALALGADLVMAGGIFAGTDESPGNVIKDKNGKMHKLFRGAASFSTQKYLAGKKPTYVEGIETFVDYVGGVKPVLERFSRGLRSSMSYFNASNLKEYKENISWTINI
jgi:IMP dehydrogenase